MRFLLIALLLTGCETSYVWYASHPERKNVTVDGSTIGVIPRGNGRYDAIGGDEGSSTSTPTLKARQVRAVESAFACKVSAADFMPGTWTLQTVCN